VRLPAAGAGAVTRPKTVPSHKAVQRRRLLAVDDEALLLKAYRRMLLSHHDVETTLGAKEALRLFGQDRAFDVVLCDLQMPEMSVPTVRDGQAALARAGPAVHLHHRWGLLAGGAAIPGEPGVACIHKPFQVAELLELIESHALRERGHASVMRLGSGDGAGPESRREQRTPRRQRQLDVLRFFARATWNPRMVARAPNGLTDREIAELRAARGATRAPWRGGGRVGGRSLGRILDVLTDEQRRDATQIRDSRREANRSVL